MTGKNNKNPNEERKMKVADAVVNSNSDVAKAAREKAIADLKARAEAVGLEEDATIEEIVEAETKKANEEHNAWLEKQKSLKEKNHKLWMLSNHITQIFAERAKTSRAGITETELKAAVGHTGASAKMVVKYTNEDKTLGYVEMEEFDVKVRVPEKGEFTFGVDYVAVNAAIAAENAGK